MNIKNNFPNSFKIGFSLVSFLFVLSLAAFFIPSSYFQVDLSQSYASPSWNHPFGFDENGVDVLVQVLKGSQVSFLVALSVTFISLIIGSLLGTLSGCFHRRLDPILMRIVDMVYAFPNFLIAMALMAVLGASVFNLILVMSVTTWATYARLVRGEVLYLKKKEFVLSVESLGAGFFRKVLLHIWPHLIPILSVQMTLTLSGVILSESGLSFLGIGVPPEIPTWGSLLQSGRQALIEAPHLSLFPGLFLFTLILGFYLLGEGLKQYFSPYSLKK